jgi:hypothetical protein
MEMVKYGIKLAIAIASAVLVVAAITVFLNLLSVIVLNGALFEVWQLVGVYMPWYPSAMNAIWIGFAAVAALRTAFFVWRATTIWQSQTG